jgi:hypothetical protein
MAGKCWLGKWREEIGIKEKRNGAAIASEFDCQKLFCKVLLELPTKYGHDL